jgi:RNA polymerase sigma factor (sigma-70 family)
MSPVVHDADFIRFYRKYFTAIFNFVFRHVLHRETAEDLTQQVFLKAYNHNKKHKPDIKNYQAWLYKIATNEILMHHRKYRDKKSMSLEDEKNSLIELLPAESKETVERFTDFFAVKQEMKKLKPAESLLIELYVFENKSFDEIAEIVNKKRETARVNFYRSLNKLKKYCRGSEE